MAGLWFVLDNTDQTTDASGGPLTFEQLAQRLADGTLTESDLVRSETEETWQPVDSVIGLSRTAKKILAQRASHVYLEAQLSVELPAIGVGESPVDQIVVRSRNHSVENLRTALSRPLPVVRILVITVVAAGIGWYVWSAFEESKRFPKPAYVQNHSEPLSLPIIGPVSFVELTVLIVDLILLVVFAMWWLLFKRKR